MGASGKKCAHCECFFSAKHDFGSEEGKFIHGSRWTRKTRLCSRSPMLIGTSSRKLCSERSRIPNHLLPAMPNYECIPARLSDARTTQTVSNKVVEEAEEEYEVGSRLATRKVLHRLHLQHSWRIVVHEGLLNCKTVMQAVEKCCLRQHVWVRGREALTKYEPPAVNVWARIMQRGSTNANEKQHNRKT